MSTLIKVLVITLCMNVVFVLTSISLGNSDALTNFFSFSDGNLKSSTDFSLNNNNTKLPINLESGSSATVIPSQSGFSFVDTIRLVFNFLILLLGTLFFPIIWGVVLGFPLWLNLLLGIQTIIGVVSLILIIRGVGV